MTRSFLKSQRGCGALKHTQASEELFYEQHKNNPTSAQKQKKAYYNFDHSRPILTGNKDNLLYELFWSLWKTNDRFWFPNFSICVNHF